MHRGFLVVHCRWTRGPGVGRGSRPVRFHSIPPRCPAAFMPRSAHRKRIISVRRQARRAQCACVCAVFRVTYSYPDLSVAVGQRWVVSTRPAPTRRTTSDRRAGVYVTTVRRDARPDGTELRGCFLSDRGDDHQASPPRRFFGDGECQRMHPGLGSRDSDWWCRGLLPSPRAFFFSMLLYDRFSAVLSLRLSHAAVHGAPAARAQLAW